MEKSHMISRLLENLADRFWEEAGWQELFPRTLEYTIQRQKPVEIISLPRLCPQAVQDWLWRRDHTVQCGSPHRWLDGCLYANHDVGFLFVEESLSPDVRRVIVAHEFAHLLTDYEAPRRSAARRLGNTVMAVLDGERPPTASEQLSASLAHVPVKAHFHFMDRTDDGEYTEPVNEVERRADALGLELVAPWRVVFWTIRQHNVWPGRVKQWEQLLRSRFGLPHGWAKSYATRLQRRARARLSFSESLGF
jgi:hypothetical protein